MNQEKEPQNNIPTEPESKKTADAGEENDIESKQETAQEAAQTSEETEEITEEAEDAGKKKKDGPSFFQSEKFKHGSMATAFTAGFIVVVILLNVIVSILADKYPSINLDVTKSGTNTLSADAIKVVDRVKIATTMYVCATKQACDTNTVSTSASTATDYSEVSRLASKIAERNSNIKVEYVDLDKNPVFAADYKSDNLAIGDVIVKTDKRYRVLAPTDLFQAQTSSDYTSQQYYSNVDASFASALNSVISDTMPVAAFDTGHSEKMDTSGYKKLLQNNSFETKDVNLLTDKIPDKTQLLVLGCPTADYTDQEIAKIDSFLKSSTLAGDRSLMISFNPGTANLPKLSSYLEEWGLQPDSAAAVAETDATKLADNNALDILANVQTSLDLGGSKSGYSNFVAPYSSPIGIKAQNVGTKTTYSLVKSNDSSYVYKESTKSSSKPQTAAQNIAALSQDTVKNGDKSYKANVIAMGSTMMFGTQVITTNIFSNGSYLADLSKYATGTSSTASNVTTTTHELYAKDISLSAAGANVLGYGVFTILIPLMVAVAGIIVYRKRRLL